MTTVPEGPSHAPSHAARVERGIRRLPNGRYEVRVHVGTDPLTGRVRQVSRTVNGGIKAARVARGRLEAEVADGRHGGTASTFGYLLDAWNAHRQQLGRAPTTLHEDRRKIDTAIRPALGAIKLDKLTTRDIDRFYGAQAEAGTSAATIRKYHAIIRAALNLAWKWGWVPANVADRATKFTPVPRKIEAPTTKQVLALIREAERGRSPHMAGIVMFGALSGLRAGELCGLRFSDVDWEEGAVVVERSIWQAGRRTGVKDTKSHLGRRVELDESAMVVLRLRADATAGACGAMGLSVPPGAYVWSRDSLGVAHLLPKSVTAAFIRVRNRLGLKVRLHDLRHYAGTEMVAAGADPRTVADQLGHADPRITLTLYASGRQDRKRDAARALGRALGSPGRA